MDEFLLKFDEKRNEYEFEKSYNKIYIILYFCIMNRIRAIILLIAFISSTTTFRELLRLPHLVAHFYKHKAEKPETTLMEFFVLHYANGNLVDEDYEQDMKLPFKTIPTSVSFDLTFQPSQLFVLEIKKIEKPYTPSQIVKFTQNFSSDSFLTSIWQPPRC